MTKDSPPLLLKPVEAARELGVTTQTLNNWRHAGRGPAWVALGAAVRYRYDAIIEYVEHNTYTSMPAARKRAGRRRGVAR